MLIDFLHSILPEKPLAELYISIGYNRHGKTEFYRDLHRFVHRSRERFVIAPGKEGAVMTVFTLPDYSYVFKVIKDRPCFLRSAAMTDKTSTRREVMEQYALRLPPRPGWPPGGHAGVREPPLPAGALRQGPAGGAPEAAREVVSVDDDHVVIRHSFVQRRVTPLPMFMAEERDPEALRRTHPRLRLLP